MSRKLGLDSGGIQKVQKPVRRAHNYFKSILPNRLNSTTGDGPLAPDSPYRNVNPRKDRKEMEVKNNKHSNVSIKETSQLCNEQLEHNKLD